MHCQFQVDVGAMLPNESILQVLHFVDYRTLVLAGFAASRFLHVYTKFTAELARRHNFQINFYGNSIWYSDVTTGGRRKSIPHVVGNQPSLAIACRELDGIIGPQVVGKLVFSENTWNTSTFAVIFESAPPLRYAEEVVLYVPHGSNIGSSSEAYMHNFDGTKALRLWVDCDAFRQFCWTFLSRESACGLRLIEFTKPSDLTRARSAIEEFVLYCVTLPPRLSGDPLELDFSENEFSGRFALRVIEVIVWKFADLVDGQRSVLRCPLSENQWQT